MPSRLRQKKSREFIFARFSSARHEKKLLFFLVDCQHFVWHKVNRIQFVLRLLEILSYCTHNNHGNLRLFILHFFSLCGN